MGATSDSEVTRELPVCRAGLAAPEPEHRELDARRGSLDRPARTVLPGRGAHGLQLSLIELQSPRQHSLEICPIARPKYPAILAWDNEVTRATHFVARYAHAPRCHSLIQRETPGLASRRQHEDIAEAIDARHRLLILKRQEMDVITTTRPSAQLGFQRAVPNEQ